MINWLEIMIVLFLIGMTLYGHYRGFVRLIISVVSFFLAIMVVQVITPQITGYLMKNQTMKSIIENQIKKTINDELPFENNYDKVSMQRTAIEKLKLPTQIKEVLIENNNTEVYQMLGVEQFIDYIANVLVRMVINAIGFVIVFILVFVVTKFVISTFNILTTIPVISGINKIAGAAVGLLQGIFLLWLLLLITSIFTETSVGQILVKQIEASKWLSLFYHSNLFAKLILALIKRML